MTFHAVNPFRMPVLSSTFSRALPTCSRAVMKRSISTQHESRKTHDEPKLKFKDYDMLAALGLGAIAGAGIGVYLTSEKASFDLVDRKKPLADRFYFITCCTGAGAIAGPVLRVAYPVLIPLTVLGGGAYAISEYKEFAEYRKTHS